MEREKKIYLVSIFIAILSLLIGLLSGIKGVLGNSIILSIVILALPYFVLRYEKRQRIKEMEERFPSFLRDLTESVRSGIPLTRAIKDASKIDYGKALSKEIEKISNQISWGMTLDKILDQFSERVGKSKRLLTGIKIIKEAYFSGGDVGSILDSVAESTSILNETEKERKSLLSQYMVLMYAIAFIFLGIIVAINKLLIPIFEATAGIEEMGFLNPCEACVEVSSDISCSICYFYDFVSLFFLRVETGAQTYYLSLFFLMAILQSVFAGIVIGVINEQSFLAGLKHSLILFGVTWGAFLILIQTGMLG